MFVNLHMYVALFSVTVNISMIILIGICIYLNFGLKL